MKKITLIPNHDHDHHHNTLLNFRFTIKVDVKVVKLRDRRLLRAAHDEWIALHEHLI